MDVYELSKECSMCKYKKSYELLKKISKVYKKFSIKSSYMTGLIIEAKEIVGEK